MESCIRSVAFHAADSDPICSQYSQADESGKNVSISAATSTHSMHKAMRSAAICSRIGNSSQGPIREATEADIAARRALIAAAKSGKVLEASPRPAQLVLSDPSTRAPSDTDRQGSAQLESSPASGPATLPSTGATSVRFDSFHGPTSLPVLHSLVHSTFNLLLMGVCRCSLQVGWSRPEIRSPLR